MGVITPALNIADLESSAKGESFEIACEDGVLADDCEG